MTADMLLTQVGSGIGPLGLLHHPWPTTKAAHIKAPGFRERHSLAYLEDGRHSQIGSFSVSHRFHGAIHPNKTPTDFMPTITFVKEKKELQIPVGANLRREMMQAGVAVYSGPHKLLHCPGLSLCGSCRVLITKGMENASPMGFMERTRLKMSIPYIGNENTMRLACQTEVMGDMSVENTPGMNLYGDNFFS